MAARRDGETNRWLETLCREGAIAGLGDGPLLERFLEQPGPAGEAAFEALVRRHGPMVLAVCMGVLRDNHAADDAFQATFFVLARRASTVRDRERLAPWLARVARRLALRARGEASRRNDREYRRPDLDREAAPAEADLVAVEAASAIRAEVERLPEADRLPILLTYWQGRSYEQTAALLSRPIGTIRSRLARARGRLRGRLTRLGLAPALAATGSAAHTGRASATQPSEALVLQTVRAVVRSAGGSWVAFGVGVVPASVSALVDGELAMMATIPWKMAAALLLVGGGVTLGVLTMARQAPAVGPGRTDTPPVASDPTSRPEAPTARLARRAEAAEPRSLLTNGGVEEGEGEAPEAWSRGASIPGVAYTWARDAAHDGRASLGLKKTVARFFPIAQWSQVVRREGDTPRLKVSAWVKADGAAKAILDAQFLDGDGRQTHAWVAYIGAKASGDPPVTHDWTRHEGVVAIPPATERIVIAPQIYGPGTIWFDDLEAEYTTDPATDPTGP